MLSFNKTERKTLKGGVRMITLKTSSFYNEGGELKKSYAVFKNNILVCEFETAEERENYLKVMGWKE